MEISDVSGRPFMQAVVSPSRNGSEPSLVELANALIELSRPAPRGGVLAGFARFEEQA